MRILFSILLVAHIVAFGQAKFEVQEFEGKILAIHPGWGFYLENIEVDLQPESRVFKLHPSYGKSILSKFKVGDVVKLKANVNVTVRERFKDKENLDYTKRWGYQFAERIEEIWVNGTWVKVPYLKEQSGEPVTATSEDRKWVAGIGKEPPQRPSVVVKLEAKVTGQYLMGGGKKAFFLNDKTVFFCNQCDYRTEKFLSIKPGDIVSFIAFDSPVKPEYVYLVEGIENIFPLGWMLEKQKGKIEAFIMKQNSVRVGLNLSGTQLSFPAEFGKAVERFANGKSVTVYYQGRNEEKSNLLPSIHAMVQGKDTLYINQFYYGAPDGKHNYQPAEIDGKITALNYSLGKKYLMSFLVDDGYYIEADGALEGQLGKYLKTGARVKIKGEERVKKEGEIYEKEYRIITPRRIEVDGKEFIVNK